MRGVWWVFAAAPLLLPGFSYFRAGPPPVAAAIPIKPHSFLSGKVFRVPERVRYQADDDHLRIKVERAPAVPSVFFLDKLCSRYLGLFCFFRVRMFDDLCPYIFSALVPHLP